MSHDVGSDLATKMGTDVAGITLGTILFASTVRAPDSDIPVDAVFVWPSGSLPPLRTMGEPDEIRAAAVHVRARDAVYATGMTLAILIHDTLRGLAVSNYLELKAGNSAPIAMGTDELGFHLFGLEFVMTYISD